MISELSIRKELFYRWIWDMEWLRLVGSLKLFVSFAEYSLFYRALFQKRPTIWRSLLIVATPYQWDVSTDMVWLRLIGSFKVSVSFAEYSLFDRALVQKEPIILRSLRSGSHHYSHGVATNPIWIMKKLYHEWWTTYMNNTQVLDMEWGDLRVNMNNTWNVFMEIWGMKKLYHKWWMKCMNNKWGIDKEWGDLRVNMNNTWNVFMEIWGMKKLYHKWWITYMNNKWITIDLSTGNEVIYG